MVCLRQSKRKEARDVRRDTHFPTQYILRGPLAIAGTMKTRPQRT